MSVAANRVGRPREVEAAFVVFLVAIVADLVMWVLGTFVIAPTGWDDMRQEMGADGATRQMALSAGFTVVTSGLFLFFVFQMRRGHKWARIVLTITSALLLVSVADIMSMNSGGSGSAGGVLRELIDAASPLLLVAVAVVLMFLPAANRYFSPNSAAAAASGTQESSAPRED
ncbi:hypothetical protein OG875_14480 [Streptomyces sp. NBC_01498]|uniref:hypothetical protein n=1 Tax=Streptomyces sp. NBC_01498 TaxID=2975870 RepID=UPI002E7B9B89|nr:hypothetical protein [Streptomyces sp. NBC_01498]WTL25702.1 hypothetical protein OG875_14480 [Streptomyces sp. NBC_01498]